MAKSVLTISWEYNYDWWRNKKWYVPCEYFHITSWNKKSLFVFYKWINSQFTYPILRTTYQNNYLFLFFASKQNCHQKYLPDGIKVG